jgi:1-acyl-sn-glycerol-3-phosphate acyltransferase
VTGKRKTPQPKSAKTTEADKAPPKKRARSRATKGAATASPPKRARAGSNGSTKHAATEQEGPFVAPPFAEMAAEDIDADEMDTELGLGARVVGPHVRFEADVSPSAPPDSSPPTRDVEAQIRALEARLDGLIRGSVRGDGALVRSVPPTPPPILEPANEPLNEPLGADPTPDSVTAAYLEQQWGREALRNRSEEVDDFGLDPVFESRVRPGIDLLYRRYFRVEVEGAHHVPASGRGVVVANHSGTLPLDGLVLRAALRLDHPNARDLRWLAEDFHFYLPFAGVFLNRVGAVRACPENAERLLEKDELVAVFPEGVHGIKKLFRDRYRLQRFGRGGYIRLCLRTRTPLIPCAIIGAEEANPVLFRFERIAELLRLPYLPVTPTFPLLGPLGLLPAPTRWKIRFGEPISFDSYGPQAADDTLLVGRLSERVRSSIQDLLDSGLRARKSVWFG